MSRMPKFNIPGQVHFVTIKVWQNIWLFKEDRYCQIIIDNLNFYRRKFDFKLLAYAIIPWHIHFLILLGEKYGNISRVIQDFKSHTAKEIVQLLKTGKRKPSLSPYFNAANEGSPLPTNYIWADKGKVHTPAKNKVWQKGFYDFNVYSSKKLFQKTNYINYNAVKHKLVDDPINWKYSSFHNYEFGDESLITIDYYEL